MILFLRSRFSSAGIGRTGTFIALDTLLKEIAVADSIDVINCVSKLRQQRAFSIQTDVSLPPPFNSLTLFEFTEDLRKQIRMLDIWYCNIISSFESQRPIFDWKYIYSTNIFEFEFLLSTHWKCGLPKNDTVVGSFSSRLNNIFLNIWSFLEISIFLQVQYAFLQEAIVHAITHYGHLTEPFHKVDEMWWVSDERCKWNRQTLLALHWNYFNNKVPNRLFQILKLHPGNTLRILPNSELNNGVSEKKIQIILEKLSKFDLIHAHNTHCTLNLWFWFNFDLYCFCFVLCI